MHKTSLEQQVTCSMQKNGYKKYLIYWKNGMVSKSGKNGHFGKAVIR